MLQKIKNCLKGLKKPEWWHVLLLVVVILIGILIRDKIIIQSEEPRLDNLYCKFEGIQWKGLFPDSSLSHQDSIKIADYFEYTACSIQVRFVFENISDLNILDFKSTGFIGNDSVDLTCRIEDEGAVFRSSRYRRVEMPYFYDGNSFHELKDFHIETDYSINQMPFRHLAQIHVMPSYSESINPQQKWSTNNMWYLYKNKHCTFTFEILRQRNYSLAKNAISKEDKSYASLTNSKWGNATAASSGSKVLWIAIMSLVIAALSLCHQFWKFYMERAKPMIATAHLIDIVTPYDENAAINVTLSIGNKGSRFMNVNYILAVLISSKGQKIRYRWEQFFKYTDGYTLAKETDPHPVAIPPKHSRLFHIQFLRRDELKGFHWLEGEYVFRLHFWINKGHDSKPNKTIDLRFVISEKEAQDIAFRAVKDKPQFIHIQLKDWLPENLNI